jgi:hypothetical protein
MAEIRRSVGKKERDGRFFGSAPIKDMARLREQGLTAADVAR